MADTINLPGDGAVKKQWVLVGGALVAGIVGYAYLRRSQQAAAGTVTPPMPSELPPADLSTVSTGGGVTDTGLQFITTNAEWSQDATNKLVALGYDGVAVSEAISKYLASQFLTAQEAQYVYAAIAFSGHPPVGSFSVRLEPTPTSTSSPPPSTTRVRPDAPQGFHATWDAVHKRYVLSWSAPAGAVGYGLYRYGVPLTFPKGTTAWVGNFTATYSVKARNAKGLYGPAATLQVTRHR